MPISAEYAILSDDMKAVLLPADAQKWLLGCERFIVVMEGDELILKKARRIRKLDELVKRDDPPLPPQELNTLIHETRKSESESRS